MARITPLAEEADSLRLWEAEAHRHEEETERAFEALSARAWQDEEEVTRVRRERDELLERDAETHQWILDLLAEAEKERELKLVAEEKLAALERKVSLDAEAVTRLCKERDELLQTVGRLHLECGAAREERDQAIRERDQAQ